MSHFLSASLCTLALFGMSSIEANAAYNPVAGKVIYDVNCAVCHKDGLAGAPKFGNKAVWAPRIAQGMPLLVSKSIKGFQGKTGMMPAKGGNAKLTDPQIGNAVAYIVSKSK